MSPDHTGNHRRKLKYVLFFSSYFNPNTPALPLQPTGAKLSSLYCWSCIAHPIRRKHPRPIGSCLVMPPYILIMIQKQGGTSQKKPLEAHPMVVPPVEISFLRRLGDYPFLSARDCKTSSAISSTCTLSSCPVDFAPSPIMVMQNGQPVAIVSAPTS